MEMNYIQTLKDILINMFEGVSAEYCTERIDKCCSKVEEEECLHEHITDVEFFKETLNEFEKLIKEACLDEFNK